MLVKYNYQKAASCQPAVEQNEEGKIRNNFSSKTWKAPLHLLISFENFWPKRGAVGGDGRRKKAATKRVKLQKDCFKKPWLWWYGCNKSRKRNDGDLRKKPSLVPQKRNPKNDAQFEINRNLRSTLMKATKAQNVILFLFAASRQKLGDYSLITFTSCS